MKPTESIHWRNVPNAKKASAMAFIISSLHTIPYVFTGGFIRKEFLLCAGVAGSSISQKIWAWWGTLISFVLPFAGLIFMNTSIIKKIRYRTKIFDTPNQETDNTDLTQISDGAQTASQTSQSKCSRKKSSKTNSTKIGSKVHERQLTIMMLSITSVFMVLALPIYMRHLVFTFYNIGSSARAIAASTLLYHVTNKAFYTNSAINFFLYVISGKVLHIFIFQSYAHFSYYYNVL